MPKKQHRSKRNLEAPEPDTNSDVASNRTNAEAEVDLVEDGSGPSDVGANGSNTDRLVGDLYGRVRDLAITRNFSLGSVATVVKKLMEFVEEVPDLEGPEKRQLVLIVLSKVAIDAGMDEGTVNMVAVIAGPVIDLAVGAAAGRLNINGGRKGKKCLCF